MAYGVLTGRIARHLAGEIGDSGFAVLLAHGEFKNLLLIVATLFFGQVKNSFLLLPSSPMRVVLRDDATSARLGANDGPLIELILPFQWGGIRRIVCHYLLSDFYTIAGTMRAPVHLAWPSPCPRKRPSVSSPCGTNDSGLVLR